ncbi:LysR family transcriptional regulator [Martelella mediterranea]|uniref:LysR family transcriptional regulator n=1 Tax=Martelella mediterranea TaxID=293089 RepID=UPI001E355EBD|nr:LysR family transcriptional regulator [Martelella mediterranea]MCD1633404.1 LysR family transcriptional regulator [Martelella mediterranea]
MDINAALKAFVRTVERGSITAAARDLGISQPAVTKHIRNLETRLNARLLERSPKNVRVTAQGAELYESCRHALASIDAALEGVRLDGGAVEGALRIHAPVCIGEKHVHGIVMDFLDAHPKTNVELLLENRQVDLIHENFDIAIRFGRIEGQDVIARRIGWLQRILVASPEFLDANPSVDAPEQLCDVALVATKNVLEKRNELQLVGDASETVNVNVTPLLTTNSAQVLLKSLLSGRGIGTIQTNQIIDEIRDGRLVRVLPNYALKPIAASFTYPSTKFMRPVVRAFTDFAITRLRGIPGISAEPTCASDAPYARRAPAAEIVAST